MERSDEIVLIAAARPNFMKIAPIAWALAARKLKFAVIHTGQHYDSNMSDIFFSELDIPHPDEHLGVGSGTHAEQTARVMMALEPVLLRRRPRWVVVVGDVNSTIAAALVCAKLRVPIAHVEAGLRSRDWEMPEEVNRVVTDRIADLLLTPSEDADENLRNEGVHPDRIVRVGNVMIDSLLRYLPRARERRVHERLGLKELGYAVVTLHRPSNVDVAPVLRGLLDALLEIGSRWPVVLPVHPRTRRQLERFGWLEQVEADPRMRLIEPLGYLDFTGLMSGARLVLTDSGGLQEETSVLGIPCLTLRKNTERPITVSQGTNRIVGTDPAAILAAVHAARDQGRTESSIPLWDGRTAERIVDVLVEREGTAGA